MKRLPLIYTVVAVLALAASLAYWFLQLYRGPQRPLAIPPPPVVIEPSIDAAARLFGGAQVQVEASSYQLTGVVAAGRDSVAIVVADGKPPLAVKVGHEVLPGVTVLEVQPRFVMLSEGGVKKRVDLAPDAKAGTDIAPPAAPTAQPGDLAPRPGAMVPSGPGGGRPLPQGALTPPPPPQMPAPVRTAGQPSEPPTEPPAEPTTEAPTQ